MPQVDSKHMEMLMINKVISRLKEGDLEKLCDTRQRYRTSLEQAIQALRALQWLIIGLIPSQQHAVRS